MIENNEIACPACEYERNSHGQPVERNGQMKCLDCGATWRVFGTALNSIRPKKQKTRIRTLSEDISFVENIVVEKPKPAEAFVSGVQDKMSSYKLGLGAVMSCFSAVLLFIGVYLGILFLTPDDKIVQLDELNIAEVEIEEQVRRSGEKIFTVKGIVSNPTSRSKTIPSIMIILRKQNGSEITRWRYNSSLASLKAGHKSRFASSIQYDTPIVAYAEAVFK